MDSVDHAGTMSDHVGIMHGMQGPAWSRIVPHGPTESLYGPAWSLHGPTWSVHDPLGSLHGPALSRMVEQSPCMV